MRPFAAALIIIGFLAACSDRPRLLTYEELQQAGEATNRPADPDKYEVTNLRCPPVPDSYDHVYVIFDITNTDDRSHYFEYQVYMEDTEGNRYNERLVPPDSYIQPGETLEWSTSIITDDAPDDAVCAVTITDSPIEIINDLEQDRR